MRIERILARAFGPFRGEELSLAPGMTVVAGPNEAGKSSWHAALRLALTGVRRGKGPGTAAERQLAERHRPWDAPDRWEVEARLELADGRKIEIRQDLGGKVDCRAVDMVLGRDVSDEILDGTPDASRWLGLNRETFAATVLVSQAQIVAVTEAVGELQEQMQRAAATQGTDGTAAEAIERLEQFRRDAVGVDRVGARGPLRTAKDRLAAQETRLAEVRRQHDEYLERSAAVEGAERRVSDARRAVLQIEAELATVHAEAARKRLAEALELSRRHPVPPEALAVRDEGADEVAAAIDGWIGRSEPVQLFGPGAAELEAELASLPLEPSGDRDVHPSVHEARRALDMAEAALAALAEQPVESGGELPAVSEDRVRDIARRLRTPQLPGAAGLEAELEEARRAATATRSGAMLPALAGVGLALVAGIALLVIGQTLLGAVLLAVGAVAGAIAWATSTESRRARARIDRAEAALVPYTAAREAAERERRAAEVEARELTLPGTSAELDLLADRLADAAATRRLVAERADRMASLSARRDAAVTALAGALAQRGQAPGDDPRAALAAYEAACRERSAVSAAAARREPLRRQIEARRSAEQSAEAAAAGVRAAERRLRAAASLAGLDPHLAPEAVCDALRAWQGRRAERLRANETAIAEWQRLQALLDGRQLSELQAVAEETERRAAGLIDRLGAPVQPRRAAPADLEARLASARQELMTVSSGADALRGNLAARREALPNVAEAEEALSAARAELQRVEALATTLDRTLGLLRAAEERVHRSLAPVLASSIARWLPSVSGGAYGEVTVDPADLSVRVKEATSGKWREARLLSEGTREQIYLLLRVAMAEHLVTNGETAPLLLDEVTVQSDPERKRQLLAMLHALSAERQVILFSHDGDVLAWADAHLSRERDAIVRLTTPRKALVDPSTPSEAAPSGVTAAVHPGP